MILGRNWKDFGVMTSCVITALFIAGCSALAVPETTSERLNIRIGWQTTWATQGQIVQVLKNTNVLEKNGLSGEFLGVSYGAPLNEAALAGEVDVLFTADQPAVALLSVDPEWVIIGRLMFNRVALYVAPDSAIDSTVDLRSKTVAMPFGAAAQRVALKAIEDAGLDPKTDVKTVNLDITEQIDIVNRGTTSSWGIVDAMAGFDPTVAILESTRQARILHQDNVVSVIMMSQEYIEDHPEAPKEFLKAFMEAYLFFAGHETMANEWFRQDSQLDFSDDILARAALVEPNVKANTIEEVDIVLTPQLILRIQESANFLLEEDLISRPVEVADHIEHSYVRAATSELFASNYDPKGVHVNE